MVKTAVMVKPRKLEVQRFDMPEVTEDAMLVKVLFGGVCGTDVHVYEGRMKAAAFPIIPGHEMVGEVAELGSEATGMEGSGLHLSEGDMVAIVPGANCGKCYFCKNIPFRPNLCEHRVAYGLTISCKDPPHLFGGWSEYVYVKPAFVVHKIPENMPNEIAVMTEPMSIATRAFERAFQPGIPYSKEGFHIGGSVVIQGAGTIGLLLVALAKIAGAGTVISIDTEDFRLKMAEELGADHIINMKEMSVEERLREVLRWTDGVGADVVIEAAGVPVAFAEGIHIVRRGGKYVELGHYTDAGTVEINPHEICRKDIDILGTWSSPHNTQFKVALQIFQTQRDRFPFEKLVTHKFKIEEGVKAIETIKQRKCIKAVIVP